MDKLFDKLFERIVVLKQREVALATDLCQGRYSRLDMAIYHLATCKSLLESAGKPSGERRRQSLVLPVPRTQKSKLIYSSAV